MSPQELETLRKKARNIFIVGFIITIILTLVSFMMLKSFFSVFFVLIFGLVITIVITSGPSKKFSLAYKETYVLKSLKSVFEDLVYEPDKGIDESIIANTGMMYMGDRYSANDYVAGKYKNINIVQSDIHIEKREVVTDRDGNTKEEWTTIFMGRWMMFDFNKSFKANIQVCQKGFWNSKLGNWDSRNTYKKVMLEDQEFNNNFRVYAQDEHEAFYVLTPTIISKIKDLSNNISGKLLFCFVDNKLHVGIANNSDSFEHSIFTKIDEEDIMNNISKDIKLITNFVDELNLDNDLFKREV